MHCRPYDNTGSFKGCYFFLFPNTRKNNFEKWVCLKRTLVLLKRDNSQMSAWINLFFQKKYFHSANMLQCLRCLYSRFAKRVLSHHIVCCADTTFFIEKLIVLFTPDAIYTRTSRQSSLDTLKNLFWIARS